MNQSRRGFLGSLAAVSAIVAGVQSNRALASITTQPIEPDKGRVLGNAMSQIRPSRRLAWFSVSTDLLRNLVGPGAVYGQSEEIGDYDYGWLHSALLLPVNCRIDSVSIHHNWDKDEVSIRVESPEFKEVPAGATCEQLHPTYRRMEDGRVEWMGWNVPQTSEISVVTSFEARNRELINVSRQMTWVDGELMYGPETVTKTGILCSAP